VDTAVPAGQAGLVGGVGEGLELQHGVRLRHQAGFDGGGSGADSDGEFDLKDVSTSKRLKTRLAAPEKVLCPVYSANGGVTMFASWYGIQAEPSIVVILLAGTVQPLIFLPA
jgi:hypothetical protein